MKKLFAIVVCVCVILTCFIACSKEAEQGTTTTQPPATSNQSTTKDNTASSTSEPVATTDESTTEATTQDEEESKTTTKIRTTNADSSISVNEALNYLEDFYGKPFRVNATIQEDGIQYFKIIDKNGNLYARVSIDLDNSKMTETIVDTNEINEYTIK